MRRLEVPERHEHRELKPSERVTLKRLPLYFAGQAKNIVQADLDQLLDLLDFLFIGKHQQGDPIQNVAEFFDGWWEPPLCSHFIGEL